MAEGANWKRLGELLKRRRGYLGYPVFERWLEHHGTTSKSGLGRTLTALENGERDNYTLATLGNAERLYEWQEGSIANVLNGGKPMPTEVTVENLLPAQAASVIAAKRWELVQLLGKVPDTALDGVRIYLTDEVLPKKK